MDHAARARALFERGYLTPTIDHALLALKDASPDLQREMRYIVGTALDRKGLGLAAQGTLSRVLDDEPDHAKALEARGISRKYLNRWPEAKQDLTRAVELDPSLTEAWRILGAVCHDLKDYEGRDKAMAVLEERDEVPGWLYQVRGKQRQDSGDAGGAEADYRAGCRKGDPMSAYYLHSSGLALETGPELASFGLDREKRNLPAEAVEYYQQGIDKGFEDPARDVRVRRMLGFQLVKLGRKDDAVAVAAALTDAHPERADAWLARGDLDGEAASYEKAYELSPSDAAVAWARHLLGAGRKEDALAVCDARLAEDADAIAAHMVRGDVLVAMEKPDEARQAWESAEALGELDARRRRVNAFGPEKGLDYFDAALGLLDNKRRDDAVVEFENAIDLLREETKVPGDECHRYLAKALYNSAFLRELKVADEIIEPNFREALELDPAYTDVMLALGNLCLRTDRTDEGLKWFARAGEVDPAAGQGWYYRARHFSENGKLEQAVEDAGKAFEAYSRRGQTRFAADAVMMRGKCNEQLGRLLDAKRDYDLAYDYGHPTGYAMGDNIRGRIAAEDPNSDEAAEVVDSIIEQIEDGECPWRHIEVLEARAAKSEKAKSLVRKLMDDEELDDDERDWLVAFLEG